ncbi:MAG: hypothetical protein GWP41_08200 [Planctomycetia bacterium]|jgi:hypothetical protein|nr:hypothetical protein [Planctomycetia bacterium]NCF98715.1 hypothetical protein [Planctomycetia bacterium]NCG13505.1 hypothetical protein [Planctomycetia bacterium]NCG57341.1 hypothetical protein [Pseudomonadota bacterium]
MKKYFLNLALGSFMLALLCHSAVLAGIAPLSAETLRKVSDVIATGEITAMTREYVGGSGESYQYLWRVTMNVDQFEKGNDSTNPLPNPIRISFVTSDGSDFVLCGPAQNPIPKIGNICRAYLEKGSLFKDEMLFPALAPNGFEIIDNKTSGAEVVILNEKPFLTGWKAIVFIALIFVVGIYSFISKTARRFSRIKRNFQQLFGKK